MFYIIGTILSKPDENGNREILKYKLVDTLSESNWELTPNQLKQIMQSPFTKVSNATLQNGNIRIQKWINKVATAESRPNMIDLVNNISKVKEDNKCPFILLSENNDEYKVTNYRGGITKFSFKGLKNRIYLDEVANCTIIDDKLIWEAEYKIIADKEFEKDIANKYKIFTAKMSMLGYGKTSFEYEIENHQVKIRNYTGTSKNVIIPSFITVIMEDAFKEVTLETLDLNEGLKIIGEFAFSPKWVSEDLENVEIPSTVELVGLGAFKNNTKMFTINSQFTTNKLKIRNNKTIVID